MSKLSVLVATSVIAALMSQANVAEAAKADKVNGVSIDCSSPSASLQNEIDNATSPTIITFTGVCVGDLTVIVDDLTLRGQTVNDTVDGTITVIGARRLTLDGFTLAGSVSGNTGVIAADGAAVRIIGLIVDGDLGAGDPVEQGIGAFHGSVVRLFGTTVQNVQTGVIAFGGSVAELRNASVVEGFTEMGVQSDQGSSVRILDSIVTMQDGSINGVFGVRHSTLTIQNSTIDAGGTTEDSILGHTIAIQEGSYARIENSIVTANSSDPTFGSTAISVLESTVRLRGNGNTISNDGGGGALQVVRGGNLIQDGGHADLAGAVEVGENSTAQFQNVTITGDLETFQDSFLKLRNRSGNAAQVTVDGDVTLSQDSTLNATDFGGGTTVTITGDLTCADNESSFAGGGVLAVGGTNSCSGF